MKTYWRFMDGEYHCFTKYAYQGAEYFVSNCGEPWPHTAIGGQRVERPQEEARCGRCDTEEQELFGSDRPMPATVQVELPDTDTDADDPGPIAWRYRR